MSTQLAALELTTFGILQSQDWLAQLALLVLQVLTEPTEQLAQLAQPEPQVQPDQTALPVQLEQLVQLEPQAQPEQPAAQVEPVELVELAQLEATDQPEQLALPDQLVQLAQRVPQVPQDLAGRFPYRLGVIQQPAAKPHCQEPTDSQPLWLTQSAQNRSTSTAFSLCVELITQLLLAHRSPD
jgi:hypothetical protein